LKSDRTLGAGKFFEALGVEPVFLDQEQQWTMQRTVLAFAPARSAFLIRVATSSKQSISGKEVDSFDAAFLERSPARFISEIF
jgi:hypothetical protein